MRRVRIAWVLGWAIPSEWFGAMAKSALPKADHVYVGPSPTTWAELEEAATAAPLDWVVGYSLGSQILLQAPDRAAALGRVALLAPIWAFAAEAGAGGRIARANVRALARLYRKSPEAALESFFLTAGLIPIQRVGDNALHHLWGLEQLERVQLSPSMPENWRAWIGEADPLLDARRTQTLVPALTIMPGATHHPAELIAAFAAASN